MPYCIFFLSEHLFLKFVKQLEVDNINYINCLYFAAVLKVWETVDWANGKTKTRVVKLVY